MSITLKIIIVFLFFINLQPAYAQTSGKLDSLDILIGKAKSDTQKINLILYKVELLANSNLDSAIALAVQTLPAAQSAKFYKGELNLRSKLITNYSFKSEFNKAAEQIQYLQNFIKPSKDSFGFGELYSAEGIFYGIQSKYDSSIYWCKKAAGIYERGGKKESLPPLYGNIAIGYQQQSNFPLALEYQMRSLHLAEETKSEGFQARTLLNIGNTYTSLQDTVRAMQYFFKAIEIAKKNKLDIVELYSYTNLASMFTNQKKWQQAYNYSMKAVNLSNVSGDKSIEAASLSKAATALSYLNKLPEAEELAKKAVSIADSAGQPLPFFQAYSSMGGIQLMKNNYRAAISFFEKGLAAFKKSDYTNVVNSEVFEQLSFCYEKIGNYSKALDNYKISAEVADSMRNRDNIQKSTELTMKFEFDKQQAVEKAEQDKKDADAKRLKNQQLFTILALGIIVLAVITIALIQFRNNRHKQKANLLLEKQKAKVEATLSELKSTQQQLIQSEKMASLGELTAGIAHEIQNPLNFVNNFSEVNREMLEELKAERLKPNAERDDDLQNELINDVINNEEKINHHGKRADAIVKGMLQHSRQTKGIKEPTDINALCDEYLRLSYHGLRAKDKNFNAVLTEVGIKTDFDETIGKINIVPQDIGRVLLNLFNNAFYTVNEKKKLLANSYQPLAQVKTRRVNDKVEIIVSDNGNGIPQNIIDKIFQPFFTTKPTGEGTGLGLSLAYDIITKEHNGIIKVESKEGEGTTFIIQLPVA